MTKIKSLDDLRNRKLQLEQSMDIREKSNNPESLVQIKVAMATCGIASGAREVMNALLEKVEKEKVPAVITQTGCMGLCYVEPTIEVLVPGMPDTIYGNVDAETAKKIVEQHIIGKQLVTDHLFDRPAADIIQKDGGR